MKMTSKFLALSAVVVGVVLGAQAQAATRLSLALNVSNALKTQVDCTKSQANFPGFKPVVKFSSKSVCQLFEKALADYVSMVSRPRTGADASEMRLNVMVAREADGWDNRLVYEGEAVLPAYITVTQSE